MQRPENKRILQQYWKKLYVTEQWQTKDQIFNDNSLIDGDKKLQKKYMFQETLFSDCDEILKIPILNYFFMTFVAHTQERYPVIA